MKKLERMTNEELVQVARKTLYIGGFFLLPWLWLVCYMYFYPVLGRESLDPRVRSYCRRSLLLGLFCFVPLIIWFTVFQLEYGFWGSVGEALLVAVPRGYYGRSS